MEVENQALQQQLHRANQERMKAIEEEQIRIRDEQRRQGDVLTRIDANTSTLPKLAERVNELEGIADTHKGALWILGVLWTGLAALFGLHSK